MTEGGWLTFRDLDGRCRRPKGSAFRVFKRLEPSLREGEHYEVLRPEHDAARIERLRADGRIYPATHNAVLLAPAAAERVVAALRSPAAP